MSASRSFESAELDLLRSLIQPVADRLAERGHGLFFVGGIVRDLLLASRAASDGDLDTPALNADFSDIDLTTDARPKAIKAALSGSAHSMWTQGERFGTIGATIGDHAFEITTHRAESYDEASRKPVVTFGDDLETDLSRRDFTINAMAIDVTSGGLVDPYGGQADLESRRLRTPLDPAISFTDDPLRMLRAARFIPRFDLTVSAEVETSARELCSRLSIVSGERIHDEIEKLLALPTPGAGLRFLAATGLLSQIGLSTAGPRLDEIAELSTARARRAGLLLELDDDHIQSFLSALRYSNADKRSTKRVVVAVRRMADTERTAPLEPLLRELATSSGDESLDDIVELAPLAGVDPETVAATRTALDRLRAIEDLDDRTPPLEGTEVMELLGVDAGPEVGAALRHLESLRLAGGPLSADDARAALTSWAVATKGEPS